MVAAANFLGGLLLLVLGAILIKTKSVNMIAGYNTAGKEEKEKYDTDKLAGYTGKLLLFGGIFLVLTGGILLLIPKTWVLLASWVLFAVYLIGGVIFLNTNGRCLKEEYRNTK